MEDIPIKYKFFFEDGTKREYTITLDGESLSLKADHDKQPPAWTELSRNQCEDCPLSTADHKYCPVAVNLDDLAQDFKDDISYSDTKVMVKTKERTYFKKTPLQEGLFSIFGIIMSTSDCPVMNFLKPMARFHLPFSSMEETIIRSTSFYLLRQYFAKEKGEEFDLEFKGLDQNYGKVMKVNQGIAGRLTSISEGDADRNAVVILTTFAQMMQIQLDDKLSDMSYLFENSE